MSLCSDLLAVAARLQPTTGFSSLSLISLSIPPPCGHGFIPLAVPLLPRAAVPRPILTLARFDPPPLLRLKVSDSSNCPPSSANPHNHRPPPRPRTLIGSLASVWREGLFLVRCSVFAAVLSVAAALSGYAQLRARAFVEARLLPAACALLGDYLQREVRVGKVRSVSPLGITLHTCSVSPHAHADEEFSCGEVPASTPARARRLGVLLLVDHELLKG